MGGPNTSAQDGGRGTYQSVTPFPQRFSCTDKEIYCSETPENSDKGGEHDKPEVVLL